MPIPRPLWSPRLGTLFFSLILLVALTACAPTPAPPAPTSAASTGATAAAAPVAPVASPAAQPTAAPVFPVTVTDSADRQVRLERQPTRIVSLSPGMTEVLFAIGAGPQVAGVDTFSDYPPETASLPKVAYSNPDLERIVALNPDLVIVATRQRAIVPDLERLGLNVFFRAEPVSIAALYDDIRLFGRITGRTHEADRLATSMQTRIDALVERVRDVPAGPRYYYELTNNLFTVSDATFVADQVKLLKGQNIVANADRPFPQVSQETIIAADPQVILLSNGPPTGNESLETVRARPGWAGISAVRDGRVYPIDGNLASRPGPRVVEAMEAIARALYPDRFR